MIVGERYGTIHAKCTSSKLVNVEISILSYVLQKPVGLYENILFIVCDVCSATTIVDVLLRYNIVFVIQLRSKVS